MLMQRDKKKVTVINMNSIGSAGLHLQAFLGDIAIGL